jgi:hypothetical protein
MFADVQLKVFNQESWMMARVAPDIFKSSHRIVSAIMLSLLKQVTIN